MKKTIFVLILLPWIASAHGTKLEMVNAAVGAALETFTKDETKAVKDAFNGVKAWVSADKVKVKAYYNNNANTVDYTCEMMHHGTEEMMMCSK
jgi:hypothetical protein